MLPNISISDWLILNGEPWRFQVVAQEGCAGAACKSFDMTGSTESPIVVEHTQCLMWLVARVVLGHHRLLQRVCSELWGHAHDRKAAESCFRDKELWEVDGRLHGEHVPSLLCSLMHFLHPVNYTQSRATGYWLSRTRLMA